MQREILYCISHPICLLHGCTNSWRLVTLAAGFFNVVPYDVFTTMIVEFSIDKEYVSVHVH